MTEVEAATKIRAKYLRALENEEWDLLPGPTFVKTFLRTYAEYLDLDPRLLVEEYRQRYERPSTQDLRPFKPGTCVPINVHREEPVPPPLPQGQRYCDSFVTPKGSTVSLHAEGSSVDEFVTLFLSTLLLAIRPLVSSRRLALVGTLRV